MADDADSKSVVGNHVRVQVPPPAFYMDKIILRSVLHFFFYCDKQCLLQLIIVFIIMFCEFPYFLKASHVLDCEIFMINEFDIFISIKKIFYNSVLLKIMQKIK